MSLNDKDKKSKSRGVDEAKLNKGLVGENKRGMAKDTAKGSPSTSRQNDYRKKYDSIRNLSSNLMKEENTPDATSEKDLGNEYFKQKKFNEAIDCYSRSIALSPTAVAYANRAMAYLKIKRFREAEDDCTEALNLDDRYIKAYSRRSTARKELGNLKQSVEDAQFALRLEPNNQEVKKQYIEAKSLYDKEMLKKMSSELTDLPGKSKVAAVNRQVGVTESVSSNSQKLGCATMQDDQKKDSDRLVPSKPPTPIVEVQRKRIRSNGKEAERPLEDVTQSSASESSKENHRRQELKPSVLELAARAASLAQSEAAKHITPPKTAYQFEVSWRGLAGDRTLQARLLKATSPVSLPQIFKNALSAPILMDIIRCTATFFIEEMEIAVQYLENLAKVSRFDMIIMCLSSPDKTEMRKIWDEVFCSNATPMEYTERLDKLRPRYCN